MKRYNIMLILFTMLMMGCEYNPWFGDRQKEPEKGVEGQGEKGKPPVVENRTGQPAEGKEKPKTPAGGTGTTGQVKPAPKTVVEGSEEQGEKGKPPVVGNKTGQPEAGKEKPKTTVVTGSGNQGQNPPATKPPVVNEIRSKLPKRPWIPSEIHKALNEATGVKTKSEEQSSTTGASAGGTSRETEKSSDRITGTEKVIVKGAEFELGG